MEEKLQIALAGLIGEREIAAGWMCLKHQVDAAKGDLSILADTILKIFSKSCHLS